ncbi:nuclear transport factor 2 family protein [Rhodopila sp.]|uniref:nuclear transport factor 2 family protein n=1 Tax=Rhodopila sp. TaxID=2480087 RepID=UPI003D0E6F22
MIDAQTIAQRYIACWNEVDAATRRQLVNALWIEDAHYADPMMQAHGQDGIDALIGGVHAKFPGCRFELAGQAEGHGPHVRFSWSLIPNHGQPLARGTDFAALAPDGRLAQVTGFLDQPLGAA